MPMVGVTHPQIARLYLNARYTLHNICNYFSDKTRKSSCWKPQEVYCLRHNLSKHILSGGTPSLARGLPHPEVGREYPILTWPDHHRTGTGVPPTPSGTGVPPTWDWSTSHLGLGYPPPHLGLGYPLEGTWDQSLRYSPERTWDQWKYYGMEMGYTPPPPDGGHTENITFRRTTYAGGNKTFKQIHLDIFIQTSSIQCTYR